MCTTDVPSLLAAKGLRVHTIFIIFYFSNKTYDRGTQKNRLDEYPHHMFRLRNKNNFFLVCTLNY